MGQVLAHSRGRTVHWVGYYTYSKEIVVIVGRNRIRVSVGLTAKGQFNFQCQHIFHC